MRYILESVDRKEDGAVTQKAYFIQGHSIKYVNERMDKLTFPRLNTKGFSLEAGAIMNDSTIADENNFNSFKSKMEYLISQGCTTVITYCHVPYERQLRAKVRKARHQMVNSSIDYVVGITTSVKTITPALIRECRKEKVPIIILNITDPRELAAVPWARMKEAMLTYPLLIVPLLNNATKKQEQQLKKEWSVLSSAFRIPTSIHFPKEHIPFPKNLVKRIGLYPKKGGLAVGSDVDYNLFFHHSQKDSPDVVVVKGRIMKAGDQFQLCPGFGKNVNIKVPGQFIAIEDAYDTSIM